MTQSDSIDLQERIRAIGLTLGASVERVLRDTLALMGSVTHKDIARFIQAIEDERIARQELRDAVFALGAQQGDLLVAVHRLEDELRALAAGIAAQPLTDPYEP